MEELIGKRFGKLVVIGCLKPKGSLLCQCDCGNKTTTNFSTLRRGKKTSCGNDSHRLDIKKCDALGCINESFLKGLCKHHYERLEYRKKYKVEYSNKQDKQPIRKKAKAKNQLHYARTPKGLFANFKRQMLKKGKQFDITLEEFVKIRVKPCESCSLVDNNFTGVGVVCSSKIVNKETVKSSCIKCRHRKPIEQFDVIKYSKNQIRRNWKKTPMASLATARYRDEYGNFICGMCFCKLKNKDYDLDHIEPIQPVDGRELSLEEFAHRTLCPDSNIMLLCKPCHKKKTGLENFVRNMVKNDINYLNKTKEEIQEDYMQKQKLKLEKGLRAKARKQNSDK